LRIADLGFRIDSRRSLPKPFNRKSAIRNPQ